MVGFRLLRMAWAVVVALHLLIPQGIGAAMAMPDPPCDRDAAGGVCCEFCLTRDDEAVSDACPIYCVTTAALSATAPVAAACFERVSPWAVADSWRGQADPPDPAPPKPTGLI